MRLHKPEHKDGYSGEGEHRFRREAERHSGGRTRTVRLPTGIGVHLHRNAVRLQTGIAFAFDRIPHKEEAAQECTVQKEIKQRRFTMKVTELKNNNGSTQAESGTLSDRTATPDRERKGSKRAQELHQVGLK